MCLPIVESSIDENPVSRARSKGLSHRSAPILFSLDFFLKRKMRLDSLVHSRRREIRTTDGREGRTMTDWKRGRSTSTYVECAGVGDGRLAKRARDGGDVREAGTGSRSGGGAWRSSVRGGRTTTSPTSSVSTMTTTEPMEPTPGGGGGWTDDAMLVDDSTASSPARGGSRRFDFGFSFGGVGGVGVGVARALAFGSPSRGAFPLDPSA